MASQRKHKPVYVVNGSGISFGSGNQAKAFAGELQTVLDQIPFDRRPEVTINVIRTDDGTTLLGGNFRGDSVRAKTTVARKK